MTVAKLMLTFFKDSDKVYVLWKTDDNAVGAMHTRLWINEVSISLEDPELLQLIGEPVMILESTGLWWIDSWVEGGSLIEGPQLIKHGAYYYLFFASGKYCQPSYAQGVARSTSILGPYSKLGVPLLSTGTIGVGSNGDKLIGPGHASFVQDEEGSWFSIFHASEGLNCNRYPYVEKLLWTDDYWPVVVTNPLVETAAPTPSPSANCADDSTWGLKKNQNGQIKKKCNWVAKQRIKKRNKLCKKAGIDGRRAKEACKVTCNTCDV